MGVGAAIGRDGGGRALGLLLALASLVLGCSNADRDDDTLSLRSRGQAATESIVVRIPSGDIGAATPTADGFLDLRDRSSVRLPNNTALPLYNLGSVSTQVGGSVTSGSITSVASVLLRNSTTVQGNVTSAGTVTTQAGVIVTGQTLQNQTIPAPVSVSWDVPLAANPAQPRTANVDATITLAPGAYGKLTAYTRSKVNLSSGVYAFSDLQVEPDAALRFTITPSNGPVVLYLDKVTSLRGKIESVSAQNPTSKGLLLVYKGTTALRLERSSNLTVVAPKARVELATGGAIYQGSVFAQGLLLEPDVKLTYVPFSYWDWVLPAKPLPACVMPAGIGKYMAAFGYQNGRSVALSAPHGPRNRFVPASTRGLLPPTSLAPGLHEEAVWVDMPATGVTWELMGQTATANLNSPACELPVVTAPATQRPAPSNHSFPSPSLPPAPSPSDEANGQNLLGPGQFIYPPPGGLIVTGTGGPTGGIPVDPSSPLDVPLGYAEHGSRNLRLVVHATPSPSEHDPAGIHIGIRARVDGNLQFEEVVEGGGSFCQTLPCTGDRTYDLTVSVDSLEDHVLEFYAWEYNEFSSSEATLVTMELDAATQALQVTAISGPTGPLGFGDMNAVITNDSFTAQLGNTLTVSDYAFNQYQFSLVLEDPPSPPQETTLVCADWTAYFVDAAAIGAPLVEGHPGENFAPAFAPNPMPEQYARLRAHDASFASFTLQVRGAFASYSTSGHLDPDGCVEVPSSALIYDETAPRGSPNGGVALHMQVGGRLVQTTSEGEVEFQVAEGSHLAHAVFGFNSFEDGPEPFAVVGALRMPPTRIDVAGPQWNHLSTVAATVSRALQELHHGDDGLPPGSYLARVGEGTQGSGVRDHLCEFVPDSAASRTVPELYIGPGHFPCATSHGPRTCEQACEDNDDCAVGVCNEGVCSCASNDDCAAGVCSSGLCTLEPDPADECRLLCSTNAHCPGGQHCAQANDVDQACDGGPCYCAWPGQGTMKYVTAHELGHIVQIAMVGGDMTGTSYLFGCPQLAPGETCESYGRLYPGSSTVLVDPPGMTPLCGCQHVENSNAEHCLQSVEDTGMAQIEGYGQYFASKIWNGAADECRFAYYKEFLDADGTCHGEAAACRPFVRENETWTLTEVPVSLDCAATKWRNSHGCGVDPLNPTANPNTFAEEHGTEYDWMTFLRGVEKDGGIAFRDVMSIYNHACHPENQQFNADGSTRPECSSTQAPVDGCYAPNLRCGDDPGFEYSNGNSVGPRPVHWFDRAASFTGPLAPQYDRGGFLDGARRKWGIDSDETGEVERLGLDHGVDQNVE